MRSIQLREAESLSPFPIGLQYNAPARGTWNIANMAMMLPESHIIFVCPAGCMRGVTLTAAEMGELDRFTAIFVTEREVLNGSGDRLIVDGAREALDALEKKPRAVFVFTSCVDQFLGTDRGLVFEELRRLYPDIGFIEAFMTPTLRKGALPPDPVMRKQMFSLLKPAKRKSNSVNFVGNNMPLPEENEFKRLIGAAGYRSLEIKGLASFSEYESMAESRLNIMIHPNGELAMDDLSKRLGIQGLKIPLTYHAREIEENFFTLAGFLGMERKKAAPILQEARMEAEAAMQKALEKIGGRPVAVDYTMTPKPFGLARFLVESGFQATDVYAESCLKSEEEDFFWLKEKNGGMVWHYPMAPGMVFGAAKERSRALALGQVAAWFLHTGYFVNVVESDGLYGFHGIKMLAELMMQASEEERDFKRLIQVKAIGCAC